MQWSTMPPKNPVVWFIFSRAYLVNHWPSALSKLFKIQIFATKQLNYFEVYYVRGNNFNTEIITPVLFIIWINKQLTFS